MPHVHFTSFLLLLIRQIQPRRESKLSWSRPFPVTACEYPSFHFYLYLLILNVCSYSQARPVCRILGGVGLEVTGCSGRKRVGQGSVLESLLCHPSSHMGLVKLFHLSVPHFSLVVLENGDPISTPLWGFCRDKNQSI